MRCPECEQRNSVIAKECASCGTKLKQKGLTTAMKFGIGGACVLVATTLYVGSILPKLADPAENLASVAKRLAAGPKSTDEARQMKADFADAVKKMLAKIGEDNPTAIARKLQMALPSAAFEVHVVDLPKGLKLVEIDTLLQATDFLVMKGTTDVKVFQLSGFEVFDDARAVSDQAGPVLVLLGHSSGQMPHRPQLKTYALLPDYVEDESEKMVPPIKGEGTARFIKNSNDVYVELSLASMAQSDGIKLVPPISADMLLRQTLRWRDARYTPEVQLGNDSFSYLYFVARGLAHPEQLTSIAKIIGGQGAKLIKEHGAESLGALTVQKTGSGAQIVSSAKNFNLTLGKTGSGWAIAKYNVADKVQQDAAASLQAGNQTAPVEVPVVESPTPAPAPVVAPAPAANNNARISTSLSSVSVRLRSRPSTSANTLVEIPRGAGIQITGQEKDWYKVNYEGKSGFVFAELVDDGKPKPLKEALAPEPVKATPPPASAGTARVTRPWAVRDEKRRAQGYARVGETVSLLSGLNNHKYKVRLSDGSIGWLDGDALDLRAPSAAPSKPAKLVKSPKAKAKPVKSEMPEFVP
ncbi:MAG: SH3 domain-containing protein [Candidatus Obscuribacterales bacterium]|nr:SH3 domain-containing protein [Candidatus Obscuribacterales bacterium]